MLHQEVKSQEEKLKMSLIGRGEWQLTNEVKDVLQITEQIYASMNEFRNENKVLLAIRYMYVFFRQVEGKMPYLFISLYNATQVRYSHYPSYKNLIYG